MLQCTLDCSITWISEISSLDRLIFPNKLNLWTMQSRKNNWKEYQNWINSLTFRWTCMNRWLVYNQSPNTNFISQKLSQEQLIIHKTKPLMKKLKKLASMLQVEYLILEIKLLMIKVLYLLEDFKLRIITIPPFRVSYLKQQSLSKN